MKIDEITTMQKCYGWVTSAIEPYRKAFSEVDDEVQLAAIVPFSITLVGSMEIIRFCGGAVKDL